MPESKRHAATPTADSNLAVIDTPSERVVHPVAPHPQPHRPGEQHQRDDEQRFADHCLNPGSSIEGSSVIVQHSGQVPEVFSVDRDAAILAMPFQDREGRVTSAISTDRLRMDSL